MLDKKLMEYVQSDVYPFHMPGHKRHFSCDFNPYQMDITEIDGFDNLHKPQEILKEAQERAARLYGAMQSFYLVNGSTCGLLAAICAATKKHQKVLVARNCHKAVYHAISLWELRADYLYPRMTKAGVLGQIDVKQIERALLQDAPSKSGSFYGESHEADSSCDWGYAAVILTSPTYDGVVSNIEEIAKCVHAYGIPLIVDEAHGAHFGLSGYFPESAVKQGADLVIQSMHKTLPSFTQTALLHVCSKRVPAARVAQFLDIFETSSPSYLFMSGMEHCIRLLTEEKEQLFEAYWDKLSDFYNRVAALKHIRILRPEHFLRKEAYQFDCSKILMFPDAKLMTARQLYDCLRTEYGLQMEMVSLYYVLAMTSIMDTGEGFLRLANALQEIDGKLDEGLVENDCCTKEQALFQILNQIYSPTKQAMTIADASESEKELLAIGDAIGRICATYVYLYPPGIPLLAPGEIVTNTAIRDMQECVRMGLELYGIEDDKIEVVQL